MAWLTYKPHKATVNQHNGDFNSLDSISVLKNCNSGGEGTNFCCPKNISLKMNHILFNMKNVIVWLSQKFKFKSA